MVCEHCGSEFRHHRKAQRYCSPECYQLAQRTLKGTIRECVICGANFEPHHKEQKCCSKPCQMKATHAAIHSKTKMKTCERCGAEYSVIISSYGCAKYCETCKLELYGSNGPYNRAKKWGVEYEAIDKLKVFRRDRWTCGICGERVNPSLRYPDPMSASLDHIVPISCGGGHIWSNVQCAHLGCNSSKYNKATNDQLRLELSA